MKKQPQQSVTSLPPSPDEERRGRMRRYAIAMSVRMLCVVLALVFDDWLRWVFVGGAVVLPYIAVVLANTASSPGSAVIARPGALALAPPVVPSPAAPGESDR